jgi:hypothetical protein
VGFILHVDSPAVDRVLPSTPPSSFPARGRRRPNRYSVWAAGVECWAGLMGFGQVCPLPYFFLLSFLFYFLFQLLIEIQICLQDFEFGTTFEIDSDVH